MFRARSCFYKILLCLFMESLNSQMYGQNIRISCLWCFCGVFASRHAWRVSRYMWACVYLRVFRVRLVTIIVSPDMRQVRHSDHKSVQESWRNETWPVQGEVMVITLALHLRPFLQMLWDEEEAAAAFLGYFPGHVGGDGEYNEAGQSR